jgi:hypothetical protein
MAALAWLGDWLLNNNPLKPKTVSAEDLALINVDDESEFASTGGAVPKETQSTRDAPHVEVGVLLLNLVGLILAFVLTDWWTMSRKPAGR